MTFLPQFTKVRVDQFTHGMVHQRASSIDPTPCIEMVFSTGGPAYKLVGTKKDLLSVAKIIKRLAEELT